MSFLQSLARKVKDIVPPSLPFTCYRLLGKVPTLQRMADKVICMTIPKMITLPEGVLFLNQSDAAVSAPIALDFFEQTELALFRKTIQPGMTVVDIGANLGLYTVIAGKLVGPNGKVFACEPEPSNFALLKKNVEANKLSNVVLFDIAVSEKAGEVELFLHHNNKGSPSLATWSEKKTPSRRVRTDTLDNLLSAYGSPAVDVIKMDIEGAEERALRGMSETIARSPRLVLFSEFFPKRIEAVSKRPAESFLQGLLDKGFTLETLPKNTNVRKKIYDTENVYALIPRGENFIDIIARK